MNFTAVDLFEFFSISKIQILRTAQLGVFERPILRRESLHFSFQILNLEIEYRFTRVKFRPVLVLDLWSYIEKICTLLRS